MSETTTQSRRAARAAANVAEEVADATLRPEMPSSLVDLFDKSMARAKDAHKNAQHNTSHAGAIAAMQRIRAMLPPHSFVD